MRLLLNIKTLCKRHGITVAELERNAGLSHSTIARWDRNAPSIDKVEAVADYFKISIDELLCRQLPSLTINEDDLLRLFRQLNKDGQEAALEYLELLQLKNIYKKSDQPGEMEA